jgi:hypothetical protein
MKKMIFRGLAIAALALSLPMMGALQASNVNPDPSAPITFSKKDGNTDIMKVEGKNIREIIIAEPNGQTVFAWKAAKKAHYTTVQMDVKQLPMSRPFLITVRYGKQYYSKLIRLEDL